MCSLQQRLESLAKELRSQTSPRDLDRMDRAIRELIHSHAAGRALRAGQRAPTFAPQTAAGERIYSDRLLFNGPLVVTFIRGAWCPFCTAELLALQAAYADIRACHATLLVLTPQTADAIRQSKLYSQLSYPVLMDPGGEIASLFGVQWHLPDYLQHLYLEMKLNLADVNGDDSWTLSMPARYVIRRDGIIAYAEINPDYTQRPEPAEFITILTHLRKMHEQPIGPG
jgi:peroxiredoxin